jgi:RNA polymerase sigma-70 factor (ECF subfamily)
LYDAYAERLLAYCLHKLGSRPEAEDAVQTTFLYAHRALLRGVVPRSEAAWLFTIAKNICRWQRRTASRRAPVADLDPEVLPSFAEGGNDLAHGLDEALASIPERQRQAILLREWRGLSCPEIASTLDLSEPATHALLTRARRSLASAYERVAGGPVLGVDLGAVLLQLRSLLVGSVAKVATTTAIVATVGLGGVTVERALVDHRPVVVGSARNHPERTPPTMGHGPATVRRATPRTLPVVVHARSFSATRKTLRTSAGGRMAPRSAIPGAGPSDVDGSDAPAGEPASASRGSTPSRPASAVQVDVPDLGAAAPGSERLPGLDPSALPPVPELPEAEPSVQALPPVPDPVTELLP